MAASHLELQGTTSALRAQMEVARERHGEVDVLRSKLAEVVLSRTLLGNR